MRVLGAAVLIVVGACGGSDAPADGPQPLVPDPAVETGCVPGPVAGTRAKVIACAEELVGGWLAAGRIGDFVLENANLRVVVRGAGEGFYQHGSKGGGIVDAARVGGEDLVKEILPAIDLAGGAFEEFVIVEAGDDGDAELVVRGPATGLDIIQSALAREVPDVIVEHRYRLAANAHALAIETRAFPRSGAASSHELYDLTFFGGRAPAFVPGRGFEIGTGGAEIVATSGTTSSYGFVYPPGVANATLIDLAGIRFTLAAGDVGKAAVQRFMIIGDGSIASVTEQAWALRETALAELTGTTAPGVDVVIESGGAPLTIARADAAGGFRAAIPPGDYTLHAEAIGRASGAPTPVSVGVGGASATVPAGATGTISVAARDGTTPVPARVVLVPAAGGGDRIEFIGATGDGNFAVPPGTWRVAVSRGLEYEAFVAANVVVGDGETATVAAAIPRVVDTAGWIALDTHLHSELSTDSTLPIDDRLRAVAAEGVEVPVSTDHDFVVDYAPIIAELGLASHLGSLVGVESSSIIWGHINGFPLARDPARTGGGGPRWHAKSPGDVFAQLHASAAVSGSIVQINHPRRGTTSLFDAIDLDTDTLVARRDPAALGLPPGTDLSDVGFDAVEVANAGTDEFEEVFEDYLALVAAGHPAAATGSSDSHGAGRFAGEARTYVFVGPGNDNPATIDPQAIVDAFHARHVVVGTGAFVTAGIVTAAGTSLPGDAVDVTGLPQVTLHVRVQAASWQPLARIRIFAGKQEIRTLELDPADTAPIRFDADVTVPTPTATTAWIVRVDPAGPGDPVLDSTTAAFTNPLLGVIQ